MSLLGSVASLPQMAMNLINSHSKQNAVASAGLTKKTGVKSLASSTGTGATQSKTATSTATQATTGIGTTFLNLLVQELQNQDPTSPMDSTQMVGQMISLNQLDQLIAINSDLTPTATQTTTTSSTGSGTGSGSGSGSGSGASSNIAGLTGVTANSSSAANLAAKQALMASPIGSAESMLSQISPNATLNAAGQSAGNAGAINLSNFNSLFGGNK